MRRVSDPIGRLFVKASNEPTGTWRRNTLSFVSQPNKPMAGKALGFRAEVDRA
jgi:hypothetical protein